METKITGAPKADNSSTADGGAAEERFQLPSFGAPQALSPERFGRARAAYRNYYRWLRLSRLALGAFIIMGGFILLWLVPWLPSGLDTSDYTPEMAFTVYLLGGAALIGLLALGLQERARRDRERLMVWATVYDEATGLHNRMYLYDRLALECERSRRSGGVFSLIVLHLRIGASESGRPLALSKTTLEMVGELVNRLTQPSDAVALLSGSELAVLATGVDKKSRAALQQRLRSAIATGLPAFLGEPAAVDVKASAATYGVDGTDAEALVHAARTAALLTPPPRSQAA